MILLPWAALACSFNSFYFYSTICLYVRSFSSFFFINFLIFIYTIHLSCVRTSPMIERLTTLFSSSASSYLRASSFSASFLFFLNYGFVYTSPDRNSSMGRSSAGDCCAVSVFTAVTKPISRYFFVQSLSRERRVIPWELVTFLRANRALVGDWSIIVDKLAGIGEVMLALFKRYSVF